jgi:hypothetical protein
MTQAEHELITPSEATEATAKKFNEMVAEDGWPAETEDGKLIRIVSKEAAPGGTVNIDADGGRWVEAAGGKVKPADDAEIAEPVDELALAREKEIADAEATTPTASTTMTPSEERTALTTAGAPLEVSPEPETGPWQPTEPETAEQTDEVEETEPPVEPLNGASPPPEPTTETETA